MLSTTRINWSQEEQALIKHLREDENIISWKLIALKINQAYPGKSRSGKQCRQRYTNYARFNQQFPKLKQWSQQQDEQLLKLFQIDGARWSFISSKMNGRSQNSLKNRFHGIMRKAMRKLLKYQKQLKIKHQKFIKQSLLIEILKEKSMPQFQNYSEIIDIIQFQSLLNRLQTSIINLLINYSSQNLKQQWIQLIGDLRKYNEQKTLVRKRKIFQKNIQIQLMVTFGNFDIKTKTNPELLRVDKSQQQANEGATSLLSIIDQANPNELNECLQQDLFDVLNENHPLSAFNEQNDFYRLNL